MKLSLPGNQEKKTQEIRLARFITAGYKACVLLAETSSYRLYGWVVTTKPTDQKKVYKYRSIEKYMIFFLNLATD